MTLNRLLRTALVNIPNANMFEAHSIMCDYGREFSHKSVYVERHGVGIHLIRDAVIQKGTGCLLFCCEMNSTSSTKIDLTN